VIAVKAYRFASGARTSGLVPVTSAPGPRGGRPLEHADHRSSLVRGQRVTADQHPIGAEPRGDLPGGMAGSGDEDGIVLPSEPITRIDEPVGDDGRRLGHARRDLLEQRHLPVGELAWRSRPLSGDHARLVAGCHDPGARPKAEAGRGAGVVVVRVREQYVVQAHRFHRLSVDLGQRREDGELLARGRRVDEVEAVSLADRVRLHDRCAQAPQPPGRLFDLHAILLDRPSPGTRRSLHPAGGSV
jgi:hypothetical protein